MEKTVEYVVGEVQRCEGFIRVKDSASEKEKEKAFKREAKKIARGIMRYGLMEIIKKNDHGYAYRIYVIMPHADRMKVMEGKNG